MKVSNMTSYNGNKVPNQFVITNGEAKYFQSYRSMIAKYDYNGLETVAIKDSDGNVIDTRTQGKRQLYLDSHYWDYSRTTSKYRNQFTGLTTAETKAGIKDGSIILTDLN